MPLLARRTAPQPFGVHAAPLFARLAGTIVELVLADRLSWGSILGSSGAQLSISIPAGARRPKSLPESRVLRGGCAGATEPQVPNLGGFHHAKGCPDTSS